MQKSRQSGQANKFEDRLKRLEEISGRLKDSGVPLDEAFRLFEEGIKLARGLEKELLKMERKIELLINQPDTAEEKPEFDLFSEEKDEA
jgi:exodeoxyribonuclease VII small subunit